MTLTILYTKLFIEFFFRILRICWHVQFTAEANTTIYPQQGMNDFHRENAKFDLNQVNFGLVQFFFVMQKINASRAANKIGHPVCFLLLWILGHKITLSPDSPKGKHPGHSSNNNKCDGYYSTDWNSQPNRCWMTALPHLWIRKYRTWNMPQFKFEFKPNEWAGHATFGKYLLNKMEY